MRATLLCCALASTLFVVSRAGANPNEIPWITDPYQARQVAQQQQRLLLLHFYTDSCGPCRKLDRDVFPRPEVIKSLNASYVAAKINAERYQDVARQCQVDRFPTDVIIDPTGRTVFRGVTPQDPLRYSGLLDKVAADSRLGDPALASAAQQQERLRYATAPSMPERAYQAAYAGTINNGFADRSSPEAAGVSGGAYQPAPTAREWVSDRGPYPAVGQPPPRESAYGVAWPSSRGNQDSDRPATGSPTAQPPESSPRGQVSDNPYVGASGPAAGGDGYARYPSVTPESNPRTPGGVARAPTNQDERRQPLQAGPASYAMPQPRSLPVGLDGYCPVTLAEEQRWQRGDPQLKSQHRDQPYFFASPRHRDKFLADPDRYTPVLCGYDPVRLLDTGEAMPGKRQHGMWYKDMIYLFADEISLERFAKAPDFYAQKSQEAMLKSCR